LIKNDVEVGHWWLTPEILTTEEAAIMRISIPNQP
jgi:hypothetical protein